MEPYASKHVATHMPVMLLAVLAIVGAVMAIVPQTAHAAAVITSESTGNVIRLAYTDAAGNSCSRDYADWQGAVSDMNALPDEESDAKLTLLGDLSIKTAYSSEEAAASTDEWYTQIIPIEHDCTVDIAGYRIELNNATQYTKLFAVKGGVSLTIEDSSDSDAGVVYAKGKSPYAIDLEGGAKATVKSGTIEDYSANGELDYAVGGAYESSFDMQGGIIKGMVSTRGNFSMEGGLIEASSPQAIVFVGNTWDTHSYSFDMTGGTIRNTLDTAPRKDMDEAITAVSITCCNTTSSITGGTIEADGGTALRLVGGMNGGRDDKSSTTIGGTARLSSKQDATIRINLRHTDASSEDEKAEQLAKRHVLTVTGDAELSSNEAIFDIYKNGEYSDKLDVNVNGGYYDYGDGVLCKPNSSKLTYPAGYVLDTGSVGSGEHAGFYGLATIKSLSQTVGGSEIGYQDFSNYDIALASAKELIDKGNGAGTYDGTLWDTFKAAYEAALPVREDANANQNEIDWFAKSVTSAQQAMVDRASENIDISNLADGVYAVQVAMRYFPTAASPSMSDGAVDHSATIVVRNGKGELFLDFKPLSLYGAWGSLMRAWWYQGGTPADAKAAAFDKNAASKRIAADYVSWQTVDPLTGETVGLVGEPSEQPSIDNTIRPKRIGIPLSYMGAANDYNKVYMRVDVDAMASMGAGEQNVIAAIDYSTIAKKDVSEADQSAADAVSNQVASLPATGKLVLSDKAEVQAARAAWQMLTDDQKVLVDEAPLKAAEARIAELEKAAKNGGGKSTKDKKAITATVGGVTYKLSGKSAVAAKGARSLKKATVRATVKIGGKAYRVTGVKAEAFKGCKKLKGVTVGKNVKSIGRSAFSGCKKLKTVTVKTRKLAKKSVKGSLKGSKVKTVQVKVGGKKANERYVKKYKKIFTKKVAGKKAAVR